MILEIIKTIFEVGKTLLGFSKEMEKAERDKRDRVSEYFSEIGKLIEDVSASLKQKQYPHDSCAQLEALAKRMPKTLEGLLPDEDIQENSKKLLAVYKIELLLHQLSKLKESEISDNLIKLDKAAGTFKALAIHLKVSSKDE